MNWKENRRFFFGRKTLEGDYIVSGYGFDKNKLSQICVIKINHKGDLIQTVGLSYHPPFLIFVVVEVCGEWVVEKVVVN